MRPPAPPPRKTGLNEANHDMGKMCNTVAAAETCTVSFVVVVRLAFKMVMSSSLSTVRRRQKQQQGMRMAKINLSSSRREESSSSSVIVAGNSGSLLNKRASFGL